jgi:uncharacterized membrane protein (UPF0182 family)
VNELDSLEQLWERITPGESGTKKVRPIQRSRGFWILIISAVLLVLFIILNITRGFYTDWLWFKDLGYGSVYTKILGTRVAIFFVAFAVFATLFVGNLVLAMRLSPKGQSTVLPVSIVNQLRRFSWWGVIGVTFIIGLIFGFIAQNSWLETMSFHYPSSGCYTAGFWARL